MQCLMDGVNQLPGLQLARAKRDPIFLFRNVHGISQAATRRALVRVQRPSYQAFPSRSETGYLIDRFYQSVSG